MRVHILAYADNVKLVMGSVRFSTIIYRLIGKKLVFIQPGCISFIKMMLKTHFLFKKKCCAFELCSSKNPGKKYVYTKILSSMTVFSIINKKCFMSTKLAY